MTAALAWVALHALWQGAVVAGLVAGLRPFISPRHADRRYRLVLAGLAASVVLPVLTAVVLGTLAGATGTQADPGPIAAIAPVAPVAITARRMAIDLSAAGGWILACWLAGSVAAAGRLLGGLALERRRRSVARPASAAWQRAARRIGRRLGLPVVPPVLVSDRVTDPVLVGFRRPAVLLPLAVAAGFGAPEIEVVLEHELAHAVRRDHRALPLIALARCLYWFHPAVRWLARTAEVERERATDDRVLASPVDPLLYARTLCRLEELRPAAASVGSALSARGGNLLERVRRVTGVPLSREWPAHVGALVAAVGLLWAGLGAAVPASVEVLRGRLMTIDGRDPAGDFRLQFLDGRLIRAVIDGRRLGPGDWAQRGTRVTLQTPPAAPLDVVVRIDGISWQPRSPAALPSTTSR